MIKTMENMSMVEKDLHRKLMKVEFKPFCFKNKTKWKLLTLLLERLTYEKKSKGNNQNEKGTPTFKKGTEHDTQRTRILFVNRIQQFHAKS